MLSLQVCHKSIGKTKRYQTHFEWLGGISYPISEDMFDIHMQSREVTARTTKTQWMVDRASTVEVHLP